MPPQRHRLFCSFLFLLEGRHCSIAAAKTFCWVFALFLTDGKQYSSACNCWCRGGRLCSVQRQCRAEAVSQEPSLCAAQRQRQHHCIHNTALPAATAHHQVSVDWHLPRQACSHDPNMLLVVWGTLCAVKPCAFVNAVRRIACVCIITADCWLDSEHAC